MRSNETRRGGQWIAEERGAIEPGPRIEDAPIQPATAPLVEFLTDGTLKALSEMYGRLKRNAAADQRRTDEVAVP